MPFRDFLGDRRNPMKGTKIDARRYALKFIFLGRFSFNISRSLGVPGIKSCNLYVTTVNAVPKTRTWEVSDLKVKRGTPKKPSFLVIFAAYWAPNPTSAPARMSLSVDILLR